MSIDLITPDVIDELGELDGRQQWIKRRFAWLRWPFLILGGLSLLACIAYGWMGPSQTPASIDVPAALLQQFSDYVPSAGHSSGLASSGLDGVSSVASSAMSLFIPLLAGLGLLGAMATFLVTGRPGPLINAGVGFAVLGSAAYMLNVFMGGLPDSEPKESSYEVVSPRASFTEAVKEHDLATVMGKLAAVGQNRTMQGHYVLVQIAAMDRVTNGDYLAKYGRAVVSSLAEDALHLKPAPRTLYALEIAANGKATSPAALAYEEGKLASKARMGAFAAILASLGALCGGVSLAMGLVRRHMLNRLDRIRGLLGMDL